VTSMSNLPTVSTHDHSLILSCIHELIDEIICCDSIPDSIDPEQSLAVFDRAFYEELREALPSYLKAYQPALHDEQPIQLFWNACKSLGLLSRGQMHSIGISVVRSLVSEIAQQVIQQGFRLEEAVSC
jgi:hypothetical protein